MTITIHVQTLTAMACVMTTLAQAALARTTTMMVTVTRELIHLTKVNTRQLSN